MHRINWSTTTRIVEWKRSIRLQASYTTDQKKILRKNHSLDPEKSAILSSIVTSETISNLIEFRKKKASIFYTK